MVGIERFERVHSDAIVRTSHADIAVWESGGRGLPIVLIHGNSSCKEIFAGQIESALGSTYRMIALDLPGHGASSDAFRPERTYSFGGYADAVVETLGGLGVDRAVVFGWSLGGHVALEMMPMWPGLRGVMISAAPPIRPGLEGVGAGFKAHPALRLIGKDAFAPEELSEFLDVTVAPPAGPMLIEAARRTDGRARAMMMASIAQGEMADERAIAEAAAVPLAVVNGAEEPFTNLDYVDSLAIPSLWEGKAHRLPGLGHAAFRQDPAAFNKLLLRFMRDVAKSVR